MYHSLFSLQEKRAITKLCRLMTAIVILYLLPSALIYSQTFNGQGGLPFPPSGTVGQTSSIATVSGVGILGGCKKIEKVTIDLNHTFDGDIALFLIAPDGSTWIELSSGNGGGADNYKITEFRDDAPTNIVNGMPPYNGQYQAEGRQNISLFPVYSNAAPLGTHTFDNTFTGINADGDWTLFLNDWVVLDVGFLNAWSITFTNGNQLQADAGADVTICPGANPVILSATPNSASLYNYSWSNNTGAGFTVVPPNSISTQPTQTTTYTVTVTSITGGCSGTDEVEVIVEPATDPGSVNFFADPALICGGQPAILNFSLGTSGNWTFNLVASSILGNTNLVYNVIGTGSTVPVSPSVTTTYTLNSVTDQITGCVFVLPDPIEVVVEVGSPPQFSVQGPPDICEGESFDLEDLVTLLNGTTVTYHDGNPPTPSNEIPSLVSPTSTTLYTLLFEKDGCTVPINVLLEVNPSGPGPNFDDATLCEGENINLNTLISPAMPGTFSGPNVTGSTFNGTNQGNFMITFTPNNLCLEESTAEITVNPSIDYTLGSTSLCSANPLFDLSDLADPNYPNGTWSGPGVSGGFFDPFGQSGNIVLTFTPDYDCAPASTTTIEVTPAEEPILNGTSLCEGSPAISLIPFQDPSFTNGSWSGDGVSGTSFDPTGLSGDILLTFTPDDDCTLPAEMIITVNPLETPDMQGTNVCALETSFDLTTLEDPFYSGGNWDGPSVNVNTFNASLVSGEVVLTYQGPGSCVLPVDITLSIEDPQQPSLFDASICEASGGYDLTQLEDPSFTNGSWSGNGVSGNTFNPLSLVGINNLTFTSSDYCVEPSTTTIEVEEGVSPALGIAELCTTGPDYDLTLLEDPAYPNGTWSGTGVNGQSFDPTNLSGNYNLSYLAPGCAFEVTTTITVNQVGTPVLSFENICEQSGLYNLALLQDPAFPNGTWSGPGVTNNFLDPEGQAGNIILTFTPDESCTNEAVTGITILTAPSAVNITNECQPGNQFYTVSFTIEGGDENSYTVNGTPAAPLFISSLIPSATDFSFIVNDANNCLPLLVQGNKNCQCFTNAGTMTNTAQLSRVCVNQVFTAAYNNNATLDSDTLLFVLHDNSGPALGNILAIQDNPNFGFPTGASLNTTYYISAVAGNALGTFIDPNDPCLSVAPGTPIQFYDIAASTSGEPAVCLSDTLQLSVNVEASLPATLYLEYQFANKTVLDTLVAFTNPLNITLIPGSWGATAGPASVLINKIMDAQCERTGVAGTFTFNVQPKRKATINPTLCKGESIVVNGITYDEAKPTGTEIVPSALAGQCDSTIQVSLTYYPEARSSYRPFVCQGENIVIHGETFDLSRPTATITLPGASIHGCDSLVDVSIRLVQPSKFTLDTTLCAGTSANILGVLFDENHPADTITLAKANAAGCDSLIEVKVNFRDQVSSTIQKSYCAGTTVTIGGIVFTAQNPSGTVVLAGTGNACDTLATVNLQFVTPPVYQLKTTICESDFIVVNGTVYNKDKLTGTEVFNNATVLGCDSTVQVQLTLLSEPKKLIQQTLCPGENITINDVVYDEANPTGSTTFANGAANGCDSLVEIKLQFYPKTIDTLRFDIRPNDSMVVDGITFKKEFTSALVPYQPGSVNGCDSATFVVVRIVNNQYQNVDIFASAPVCPDDQNGSITLQTVEGCLISTLIIDGINYGQVNLPFVLSDLKPGDYKVELSSADGCSYKETISVSEATQPQTFTVTPDSQLVYFGEDTPLDIEISPAPSLIQWDPANQLSCSDCPKPSVLGPTSNIDFTLTLQDAKGCEQTAQFRLLVEEKDPVIVFPNVLQPGSGSSNNEWVIQPGDGYTIQSVDIFDRWGSRVFTTGVVTSPISWNGTFNGCQLSPGVYTFVVKVTYRNGKTESLLGDITLIY